MTQKKDKTTERRWLRSVIEASAEPLPDFTWMRSNRSKPESLDEAAAKKAVSPRRPAGPSRNSIAAR
ncbi:MAG: hypothetical protein IAE87_14335 [Rhodobacteraceae bacterium]|jgi:hypothetical protein|nr:hypothetical protein [Paracoccaceae bacterium]